MDKAFTEVLTMAGGKEAIEAFMPFWERKKFVIVD